jgi:zinc protease
MIRWLTVSATAFLLVLIIAVSPVAAQVGGDQLSVREGRSPRGIRFAFLPQPSEPRVALAFSWWDGFGQAQPGQELLGRMGVAWLQAGTQRLPEGQFREELRDDEVQLGLGAGNRVTDGFLSAPPGKFALAAERLREVLLTPALSERALGRLRRRHAASIEQDRATPSRLARSVLVELLAGSSAFALEQATASARLRSAAERLGRSEVDAWRQAVLARDTLVVGAAGSTTEAEVVAAIDRAFGDLPEQSSLPPGVPVNFRLDAPTVVIERPVSQTSVVLGAGSSLVWADEHNHTLNRIALTAFAAGPSSRLFRAVRDELGASYGSSAELPMMGGAACYLVISSSVDPVRAPQALSVLRAEYERFLREGLTDAEFDSARARVVNQLEEQARRTGSAAALLRERLRQDRRADEVERSLEHLRSGITREEVNAHVRRHWPDARLTTVIVAPSSDIFAADCVVRADEGPERCISPR